MKNKRTPDIRFGGFTGDWEQRKFQDFISKAGKKNTMGENYSAYSVSNKLGLVSQTEQFDGSRLDDLDKTSYKLVNPNEFAYNPARINVGSIAFNNLNKTVIVSSLYVVLKMNEELDNEFILQFMKSQLFIDEVRRNTEGSVREYLFFENFKNIKCPYTPNKDEQAKIGNFFKQLDDTIALHQQELTTLKQTKQGFLQKMFPKEGESVPEVRFPGFTGDWEQRKFQDFISKAGKKNTIGENYSAYSVSNKLGLVSQTEQFDGSRLDDLDKTSYKLVNPNEFAYNPARINVGSIAFNNLNKTVIVSSLYVVLKMNEELDNEFILQFIKSQLFIDEVRRNTEGSVREYLFFENFKNIKFPYTSSKDEQIKIGNFFKQLDDTIALHQRELDTLKETKKAFLQKMFA
ncbi:restriction endonuclease subunit S [Bacillus cereus]|uniref:restriction endonuclease subunit S n=1 Tax=Bacillus cereus TaxID=1396 RepID=UPI00197ADFCD|nr:restriction endonuclease subunit S [Bacillus cereus]